MVELRKRKPAAEPPAPPPSRKKSNPLSKAVDKAKEAITGNKTNGAASASSAVTVGETVSLDSFGGEIETHEGEKTTLKKLVEQSKSGVVLFTYPKAGTPGCTTQACLFRDAYTHLTSTGLSIYGLSTDSPKSNTTFKTKQSLPYPLLCDPSSTLISAIGFAKAPKSATRGVFVIDKQGKVLAREPGGPQATVDLVANLIKEGKVGTAGDEAATAQAVKETAAEAPVTEKEDTAPIADRTATSTVAETNATAPPATEISTAPPAPTTGATLAPPKMDEPPLVHTPSGSEQDEANTAADVAESAAKIDGEGVGVGAEKVVT